MLHISLNAVVLSLRRTIIEEAVIVEEEADHWKLCALILLLEINEVGGVDAKDLWRSVGDLTDDLRANPKPVTKLRQ